MFHSVVSKALQHVEKVGFAPAIQPMKMAAVARHGAGYLEVSRPTRVMEGLVRHPLGPRRLPQPLAAK